MIEDILKERQKTHGEFKDNALISQNLKMFFRKCEGWDCMDNVQREALDMIALKLSRILSGNYKVEDHWDDIAGYAKLGKNDG